MERRNKLRGLTQQQSVAEFKSMVRAKDANLQRRFAPLLKFLLESAMSDSLSEDDYPHVRPPPPKPTVTGKKKGAKKDEEKKDKKKDKRGASAAAAAAGKHFSADDKKKDAALTYSGARTIVFLADGASYSEIRTAYEISSASEREVIIGASALLTPRQFIELVTATGTPPGSAAAAAASALSPSSIELGI
jgi:syntaxin-binding protein 1